MLFLGLLLEFKLERLTEMKIGDILCATWGFGQTNVNFYKVYHVSKTGKTVGVEQLETKISKVLAPMEEMTVPGKVLGPMHKKYKVRQRLNLNDETVEYIEIASYQRASKWGGEEVRQTSWY